MEKAHRSTSEPATIFGLGASFDPRGLDVIWSVLRRLVSEGRRFRHRLSRSPREGRIIIYRSDVEGMRSLIAFLVNDCCNEHPELCNSVATPSISGGSRNAYF
jgi:hypothetical protein